MDGMACCLAMCTVQMILSEAGDTVYQHTSQASEPLWLEGRHRQVLGSNNALLIDYEARYR